MLPTNAVAKVCKRTMDNRRAWQQLPHGTAPPKIRPVGRCVREYAPFTRSDEISNTELKRTYVV